MATDEDNGEATTVTGQKVAAVIYNPIKVDLDAIKAAVATEESNAGWGPTLYYETSKEDPGQGAAERAIADGVDMVIAAGGDGTVRAIAEVVYKSEASLGLLPSGTGNLLARNLKLTLEDLDHSIHTAFSGDDRAIDIGAIELRREDHSITRHSFLVMAGLGLDAKMLANTDEDLKKKVGWLAYVGAIVKALRDKNDLRMRYNLDNKGVRSVRAHTIIIGNCGALQANVLLLPEAAVDDGLFEIVIFRPEGFVGWVQIAVKVFWENGVLRRLRFGKKLMTDEVDSLRYIKGKELTVRLSRAEQVELDGDGFGNAVALKTWVEPGALRVRVPAEDE